MKPNFIGIGAQKCASTWVHRILQDHPQAWVSKPKELNFFSYFYDHGFQWYERFFENASNRIAIGEISPSYFYDPAAPYRAYRYNPNMRIVVTLRDPIERAYSNHLFEIALGHFKGHDLSFETGLENNLMYVEQSRYASYLKGWFETFPRNQFLILLQEEIASSPAIQTRRLYEFLGIDRLRQSAFLNERVNKSYLLRIRGIEETIGLVGRAARKLGFWQLIRMMKTTGIVSAVHNFNRLDLRKLVPPMSEQTKVALYEELSEDVCELADLLGWKQLPWPTWEAASSSNRAGNNIPRSQA